MLVALVVDLPASSLSPFTCVVCGFNSPCLSRLQINWAELNIWQRVNHFQNAKQLCRKDNLKRHVQRLSNIPGKLGAFFDILPVIALCFALRFASLGGLLVSANALTLLELVVWLDLQHAQACHS